MKGKGKKKDSPGAPKKRVKRGKAGAGNGKAPTGLKYPFDSLEKGQSFTIPDADKPAGKVTVFQNVKVLCYEFGKRHGLKFRVKRTDDGQVECTRIK